MKKLLALLLLIATYSSKASTTISTPTVSGTWNLAGSPYLVNNSISISSGTSLTIDAGVSVIFQGHHQLVVTGSLIASGTSTQPISFSINDTTGWWNPATPAGSWKGISFEPYSGTGPDLSILKYCNISYTKFDSTDGTLSDINTVYVQRGLSISNCNFTHNKSDYKQMIYVLTDTGETFKMNNCTVSNNTFKPPVMFISNLFSGNDTLSGNTFSQNSTGNTLIQCAAVDMLFENNELHDNSADRGVLTYQEIAVSGTVKVSHTLVRNNKIYKNTSIHSAAINCYSGKITFSTNLICNNHHTSNLCAARDGGGGLNLAFTGSGPTDSNLYIVKNNVIANNYSPYHGGGINIYWAKTLIANNQIVNNKSADGGGIYIFSLEANKFKNNLFYGNVTVTDTSALNTPNLAGYAYNTILYENNWSQHPPTFDLNLGTSYTLTGDTTTNVKGDDPLMRTPTLTADYLESAVTSDFNLLPLSGCIDKGDSTGAVVENYDYAGTIRIIGTTIDIGAFEFNPITLSTSAEPTKSLSASIFPNPATNTLNVVSSEIIDHITITNLMGKVIFTQNYQSNSVQLALDNLVTGMYVLTINDRISQKFVKQ